MSTSALKKIILFLVICLLLTAIIIASALAFKLFGVNQKISGDASKDLNTLSDEPPLQETGFSILPSIPERTNIAIYGVDKGGNLADVIIVCSYCKTTNELNMLSVPRDTKVRFSRDELKALNEKNIYPPSGNIKINSIHSYSGKYGNEYLTKRLESLLSIKIDYYFEIDLKAFVKLVDSVGGIEIDVPSRMYYRDPTQNLLINLKKGRQVLNGEQAQGFVRFRQYVTGDIQRINMQKLFLKELFRQVFNKESLSSNLPALAKIFFEDVETNMSLFEGLKYIPYITKVSADNIVAETLPGDGRTPYTHDEEKTAELVDRLFYGITTEATSESQTVEEPQE